jgi:DNA polymerase (family X)
VTLAGKISTIVKSGHFDLFDSLKRRLPGQLGEIAALPGLSPKRVKLLYDNLRLRVGRESRLARQRGSWLHPPGGCTDGYR